MKKNEVLVSTLTLLENKLMAKEQVLEIINSITNTTPTQESLPTSNVQTPEKYDKCLKHPFIRYRYVIVKQCFPVIFQKKQ